MKNLLVFTSHRPFSLPSIAIVVIAAFSASVLSAADPPLVKKLSDRPVDTKASEAKIRAALQKTGDFQFTEQPLGKVMAILSDRFEIPIQLDNYALAGVDITNEQAVTCDLKGGTLKQALRELLRKLELTYELRTESLVITRPEEVCGYMETKIYSVNHLVDRETKNIDELVNVVCRNIAPETWDRVGGPATLTPFQLRGKTMLVCDQDPHHQKEVASFLERLAKVLER